MSNQTDRPIDLPSLFGPEMLADPYPIYHQLRSNAPVHWHEPFSAWILTRYRDVNAALHDPRLSAARTGPMQAAANRPELDAFFSFIGKRMIFTDPPQHTRLRGLVSQAFKPHIIEGLRSHIQTLVDHFLDAGMRQGKFDVIADLALPLPQTVIAELLGVPPADRVRLKKLSDEFILIISRDPASIPPEVWQRTAVAAEELTSYFRAIVAERRAQPRDDLLTLLEQAEEQGDRLSEEELFATANLLMVAGHETTTNLIGNGLLALLRNPAQLQLLREDPALVPQAVEELLRYDPPVQFVYRLALEDLEIGGQQIRQGEVVHLLLGAANRDPKQFANPDQLDIRRAPNHHLAFSQGIHYCLGAPLARMEGQIALTTLLERMPAMRLADVPLTYGKNFNMRGLESLPVCY